MGSPDRLALLILAAGKGTRMRSRLPKVLHPICGRSILAHQLALGRELGASRIAVVVGTGEEDRQVEATLASEKVDIVRQREQLGTAHAALQAREVLGDHDGTILILYGDHPLYRASTLARLLEIRRETAADLVIQTAEFPDPSGYGRVVRGRDRGIERVVEEREASPALRAIREINLGNYLARAGLLFDALARVGNRNRKHEYYLTDLVELAVGQGLRVESCSVEDWSEALGVNTRADLARAEAILRRRIAEHWMEQGVGLIDPERTYIDVDVEIGPDTVLEPGCTLRGRTRVGAACRIASGAVIDESTLGDGVWIKPNSWIEQSSLGRDCIVGPSAHLRPGNLLGDGVRIGNFVELKNSRIGAGTKADHLSYIGDADVGERVTFACGAITVNYDGRNKSRTLVGDGAFIGCNSNLIAPVSVQAGAYVAAGSTITSEVPSGALGIARARQRNVLGWFARRFGKRDKDRGED